jgi:lysophospholipase L1-like esterase
MQQLFRRVWPVLFVCGLAAMTCVRPGHAAAPPADPLPHVTATLAHGQPLRITAFGSSSTEGVGAASPAGSYPSRLQVELNARLGDGGASVANRGVGGDDVDDMMRRLPAIIAEHPDLVIWQTGTNDPLRGVEVDHFTDLTRQGIEAMRAAGIDVMLMGPQLCRRLAETVGAQRFRDAVRAIGEDMHVPVIRRYTMMREWLARHMLTETELLSPDGLHMADGGYALLAKEVAHTVLAGRRPAGALAAAK